MSDIENSLQALALGHGQTFLLSDLPSLGSSEIRRAANAARRPASRQTVLDFADCIGTDALRIESVWALPNIFREETDPIPVTLEEWKTAIDTISEFLGQMCPAEPSPSIPGVSGRGLAMENLARSLSSAQWEQARAGMLSTVSLSNAQYQLLESGCAGMAFGSSRNIAAELRATLQALLKSGRVVSNVTDIGIVRQGIRGLIFSALRDPVVAKFRPDMDARVPTRTKTQRIETVGDLLARIRKREPRTIFEISPELLAKPVLTFGESFASPVELFRSVGVLYGLRFEKTVSGKLRLGQPTSPGRIKLKDGDETLNSLVPDPIRRILSFGVKPQNSPMNPDKMSGEQYLKQLATRREERAMLVSQNAARTARTFCEPLIKGWSLWNSPV